MGGRDPRVGDQAGWVGVSFFFIPVAGAVGSVGNPVGFSKRCGQAGYTGRGLEDERGAGLSTPRHCPQPFVAGGARSNQARGTTPLPAVASARRRDGPSVATRWAWWRSRSTEAVAKVLGMMVSKPAGWRLLVTATLRFS